MIPRLAGDARNLGDFLMAVRRRFDEGDIGDFAVASFAEDQEKICFGRRSTWPLP